MTVAWGFEKVFVLWNVYSVKGSIELPYVQGCPSLPQDKLCNSRFIAIL